MARQHLQDDMNIIKIRSRIVFIDAFKLISKFEKAMGCKLNRNKTKLFGVGNWKDKT